MGDAYEAMDAGRPLSKVEQLEAQVAELKVDNEKLQRQVDTWQYYQLFVKNRGFDSITSAMAELSKLNTWNERLKAQLKEWESDADTFAYIRVYFLTIERDGTWYRIRQGESPIELAYELSLTVAVKKAVEALQD